MKACNFLITVAVTFQQKKNLGGQHSQLDVGAKVSTFSDFIQNSESESSAVNASVLPSTFNSLSLMHVGTMRRPVTLRTLVLFGVYVQSNFTCLLQIQSHLAKVNDLVWKL